MSSNCHYILWFFWSSNCDWKSGRVIEIVIGFEKFNYFKPGHNSTAVVVSIVFKHDPLTVRIAL